MAMVLINAIRNRTGLEWQHDANCHGHADLFYAQAHLAGRARDVLTDTAAAAIALCNACPVMDACRHWARTNREYGIWGGETELQRARAGFAPRDPVGAVQRVATEVRRQREDATG